MSEARALTNLVGNGVATIVVARFTGELDQKQLARALDGDSWIEAQDPELILDQQKEKMK